MSVSEPFAIVTRGRAEPAVRRWAARPRPEQLAWAGLGVLLVCGLVIAGSAASTDLLLPQSVRPVPSWLAGVFGPHWVNLGLGGIITVMAVMFAAYVITVRGSRRLPVRAIVIAIAVLHALMLLGPPLISTDVFSYIAYGRLGRVYAANPYLSGPSAIQLDHVYAYVGAQWVTTPTAYGPVFTALSYLLAPLSIPGQVLAYKLIAAGASLTAVWLVWKAAVLRGVDPVRAIVLVGLNPVIVVFGVGGGHNDMLMLAILLGGICALLQDRERSGGAMIVLAAAVKLTGGVLAPFALARHSRAPSGGGRRAILTGLGLALAIAVAFSFGLFGTGPLHLLATLQGVQRQGGVHSVPGLLLAGLGLTGLSGPIGIVLDAGLIVLLVVLVRRVWRGQMDWLVGAGWATVGLLVTAGLLLPWYVGWLVPLAALSRDRRLLQATLALTMLGMTTV